MSDSHATTSVLLVGHCGFDSGMLSRVVRQALGSEVPIHNVSSRSQLEQADPGALLLINRSLGGGFGAADGIDLIKQLASSSASPRMMLISNYADAQAQAQAAGAAPGFGKADAHSDEAARRLRDAATAAST